MNPTAGSAGHVMRGAGKQMTFDDNIDCGEPFMPQTEAIQRLSCILDALGINLLPPGDLAAFAHAVDWTVTRRAVFAQSESATVARETAAWISKVRARSGELAALLAFPPGNAEFNVEQRFDFSQFDGYGLLSISELEPMLRALAQAAKDAEGSPTLGRPAMGKTIGRSPADRFIQDLAADYEKFTTLKPRVERVTAEGLKGGQFPDFVAAVARDWGQDAPSVEAVAAALRKRSD